MPVSLDAKLAAPSSSASKPTPPKLQCKELGGFGPPEAQAGELGDIYFDTTVGSCAMYGKIAGESGPYWKKWPGPDPQHLPIPHPKFPRHYLWALVPVGHAMGWIEAARAIPIVATEFDTSVLIARKLADRRKSRDRYSETKRKRNDGDGASSEPLSQKRKHSDDDDDAMAPEVPDEAQKQVVLRRTKIFKPYSNEPGRPQIQERYTEFQGIGAPDGKHADIGDIYVDLTEGSNALYGKLQSGWVKWPGSDDPAHPLIEHPKFPNIYLWVGKGNFAMGWVPCSRVKYRSDVSASSAIEMKLKYREKTLGYVSKHTKKDKADSPPFHGRTISTTAVDKSSMAHQVHLYLF
ncbi:hypothetical protein C8J56DRAFT_155383 [Mycena floridula]|nr:hypothetical protein C8J56DRAFT_155383 [Mycena floridula]